MKKLLLLLVMILLPMVASAETVEIDGIWYNLVSKTKQAEVTRNPDKQSKYTGDVIIPESVSYENMNYSVTSIGYMAFNKCSGLTSVTIPSSVKSIEESTFADCKGLTSVTIPNSVVSIGGYAFYNCSSLTSVTIPNSVTSIGDKAFYNCLGLTKVIVSDIAAWCGIKFGFVANPLYYCHHLYSDENTEIKDLVIPNSVTSIERYAFEGCSGLTSVTIGNNVTNIAEGAFSECLGLTSVTMANSVMSIESYAFYGCSSLTTITISSSVTSIEKSVFGECSSLTSVTIPNSVKSIGSMSFLKCTSLTSVTIPNSVTSIEEGAFSGCSGLTSVTIGNNVTNIAESAFNGCFGLTSITIPNSVTIIELRAFYGCSSLTSVTIGSGMKTIGSSAFASCPELTDVYCHAVNVPNTKSDAFNDSYINYATLHVPSASVNAYRAADPWKNFKSVVNLEGGDNPEPSKCATPTISYTNGTLTFNCDTEGAGCQYTISDNDIKSGVDNKVQLAVTYNISVYATKAGYENSDTATATLCWIDQKPATEGITDGIANVPARALLIKNNSGQLTVEGAADGEAISVYTVNGVQSGSAISQNGAASIDTNLQTGSIAIVKIGDKSVKVVIK